LGGFLENYILTIITVVLTNAITLFAVWLTNKGNIKNLKIEFELKQKEAKIALLQEKQEELYIKSKLYLDSLFFYYIPYIQVMLDKMNLEQAFKEINRQIEENTTKIDIKRINMLIGIYYPEVKQKFNEILMIREKLNEVVSKFKKELENGIHNGILYINEFTINHNKLIKLTEEFEECIFNINIYKKVNKST